MAQIQSCKRSSPHTDIQCYDPGAWGMTDSVAAKLDAFHREQLRSVVGFHWPQVISNADLYARCNTERVSVSIATTRWRLFGHVLRLDGDVPAHAAVQAYFSVRDMLTGYRGRPRTELPTVLHNDLTSIGRSLNNCTDLCRLREIARTRYGWRQLVKSSTRNMCTTEQI